MKHVAKLILASFISFLAIPAFAQEAYTLVDNAQQTVKIVPYSFDLKKIDGEIFYQIKIQSKSNRMPNLEFSTQLIEILSNDCREGETKEVFMTGLPSKGKNYRAAFPASLNKDNGTIYDTLAQTICILYDKFHADESMKLWNKTYGYTRDVMQEAKDSEWLFMKKGELGNYELFGEYVGYFNEYTRSAIRLKYADHIPKKNTIHWYYVKSSDCSANTPTSVEIRNLDGEVVQLPDTPEQLDVNRMMANSLCIYTRDKPNKT